MERDLFDVHDDLVEEIKVTNLIIKVLVNKLAKAEERLYVIEARRNAVEAHFEI